MELKKINEVVSVYKEPVFGALESKKRVMALSVDKDSNNPIRGLAREIVKTKGEIGVSGWVDESKLIIVESENLLSWKKTSDLEINGIKEIIDKFSDKDKTFLGLEDPDIWTDEKGIKHVYFTIAFKYKTKSGCEIYLGHAQGTNLETLKATFPVLSPITKKSKGFKEVTISPIVDKGKRINLVESWILQEDNHSFPTIAIVEATKMGQPWNFKYFFDIKKKGYYWCKGELSPCCFIPKSMISFGKYLAVIVNGREPRKLINKKEVFGTYRPGLILFDPKNGEIPWIAKEPLFEDPNAKSITFASDFIQTSKDEGILYCHIDDSFVRAYKIDGKSLFAYLKKNCSLNVDK